MEDFIKDMEIRDNIRKLIIDELLDSNIVQSKKNTKFVKQKIKISESDQVATSTKGTKYIKSEVFKYLCQQGLRATQENIDVAAEMFKFVEDETGEMFTEVSVSVNENSNILNDMTNDEIMAYINTQTLITLNELRKNRNEFEYSVITIRDNQYGSTDTHMLIDRINKEAKNGWRVVQIFTNELGKNESGIGYGGISVSTNATIDEVVVIFERAKSL